MSSHQNSLYCVDICLKREKRKMLEAQSGSCCNNSCTRQTLYQSLLIKTILPIHLLSLTYFFCPPRDLYIFEIPHLELLKQHHYFEYDLLTCPKTISEHFNLKPSLNSFMNIWSGPKLKTLLKYNRFCPPLIVTTNLSCLKALALHQGMTVTWTVFVIMLFLPNNFHFMHQFSFST